MSGSVLARLILVGSATCGLTGCRPAEPADANGFWISSDGGTQLVVFEYSGRQAWNAKALVLRKLGMQLDFDCRDPQRTIDGGVVWNSATWADAYESRVQPEVDGGLRLEFHFGGSYVDDRYRRRTTSNDLSNVVGPVNARFSVGLGLASPDRGTFAYQVEYFDSEKVLSSEGDSFTVSRVQVCR